ncbi:YccS family putative transporter [Oleiagrimonas sp. MCCC 1A03011]|uniref:YccS family putative transporter n=1 Tax=Oleiagrimonas sp. MCCC 1A03011 TaxID=1926883 RepID=UPI000DC48E48|nr:YccS family putative transporter [Oleiagrimonas sp. MCCC 1A03011]RAP56442.1 TIGR01666 family membrane protein [Oleiagrimonas sp. MCCC 1A03011]
MPSSPLAALRRLSAPDRFADALRVLLAMLGAVAYGLLAQQPHVMIALLLGVIAAALAETEDGWRRRLQALIGTLLCFALAAFAVEATFALPLAFAAALTLGSFLLVMLGAASPRYATIASATLLLAVYTMIGMDQPGANALPIWHEPLLLVAGAAWYGLFAMGWSVLFVQHPVRQTLARLYATLGDYLDAKAQLFEPMRDLPVPTLRARLAQINGDVVEALNGCRLTLIDRLDRRRPHAALERSLSLYLAAQDIHERASSSHYPYQELAQAFFHSDVMFRAQRVMRGLAQACRQRAADERVGAAFRWSDELDESIRELREAVTRHRAGPESAPPELLQALDRLIDNLHHLMRRIACAEAPDAEDADRSLHDPTPSGPIEALRRIRTQLTPTSARFRHALRLSLAMLIGYLVLRLIHPGQGYWILLTVMLVCQPSHGATRQRVLQRIGGTFVGLLAGWALLTLFPDPRAQLAWTVAGGVLFFVTRYRRYLVATAAVTAFVLLAFNQIGNGFELIVPRMLDTLLGGAIAVAVTLLVLPDWRERELGTLYAELLRAQAGYLEAIVAQYASGKRDDLPYRRARRDAHEADAELSAHLGHARSDPAGQRADADLTLRLLAASQELLGHLSALGAHRPTSPVPDTARAIPTQGSALAARMHALADGSSMNDQDRSDAGQSVVSTDETMPAEQRVALTQLRLLREQLPVLEELYRHTRSNAR